MSRIVLISAEGTSVQYYTDNFVASGTVNSSLTTHTFTAVPFGVANAVRRLVVGISHNTGIATHDTMTVGGTSATRLVMANAAANANNASLWECAEGTLTSGDIVLTASVAIQLVSYMVWSIGRSHADATGTKTMLDVTSPPLTGTIDLDAGGLVIALSSLTSVTDQTAAWVGVTEDVATDVSTLESSGGRYEADTAEVGRTITPTWSGTTERTLVAAAFGARLVA